MNEPTQREGGAPSEGPPAGRAAWRAANVTLLVAVLLFAFTAAAFFTGQAGRVGYGWPTLVASAGLAASAYGMRRGFSLCAFVAAALLGALLAVWALRLTAGLDLGLTIWVAICLIALRDIWLGREGFSPRRK